MLRQDVECAAIRSAEDKIKRPFRHIDSLYLFSLRVINQKLAGGQIDVAALVLRKALSALFRKELKVADVTIGGHLSLVSSLFRFFGHVEWMADNCLLQAEPPRSEEHTSELQSLRHLVCR